MNIDTGFEGTVTIRKQVVCNCPYADMTDVYDLEVVLQPHGEIVELERFGDWLDEFREKELTQEQVTERIYGKVSGVCRNARVSLVGEHFGFEVVTERGEVER